MGLDADTLAARSRSRTANGQNPQRLEGVEEELEEPSPRAFFQSTSTDEPINKERTSYEGIALLAITMSKDSYS